MKKTLSLLLALVMLLAMIPLTAFAADEYVISDKTLSEGSNTVTLKSGAEYTLFEFTADTAATYTFIAPAGTQLADYGASHYAHNITVSSGGTMSNTLDLTFTAADTSKLVGVYNPSGSTKSISISVKQGADYVEYVTPLYTYVNKATLSQFTLPADAELGDYIDVFSKTNHKAVKGSDGYYHLDSASGDILLVDLDYPAKLSVALTGGRGVMYVYVTENGKEVKYDIGTAIKEYEAVADSNMYYPLTEDLLFFYQDYAEGNGVYQYHYPDQGYNENIVWMFACRTMKTSSSGNANSLGDLNLDGAVTAADLTLLARHVAGIENLSGTALSNADVNQNGAVTADDLTLHARFVAGIIDSWEEG